jgi:hypothetical protein
VNLPLAENPRVHDRRRPSSGLLPRGAVYLAPLAPSRPLSDRLIVDTVNGRTAAVLRRPRLPQTTVEINRRRLIHAPTCPRRELTRSQHRAVAMDGSVGQGGENGMALNLCALEA